jgi:hypothetical protein
MNLKKARPRPPRQTGRIPDAVRRGGEWVYFGMRVHPVVHPQANFQSLRPMEVCLNDAAMVETAINTPSDNTNKHIYIYNTENVHIIHTVITHSTRTLSKHE